MQKTTPQEMKHLSLSDYEDYLSEAQINAAAKLSTGKILYGDVGSGKSRTALAYYIYAHLQENKKLFIITTAKKRDSLEWYDEINLLGLDRGGPEIVIDSWNNVQKYVAITDAFFIFDEQRVVGTGEWVKSFIKIAKFNDWILLTATPGDDYKDYIPVLVANRFYKNRTDFMRKHVIYSPYTTYPKIDGYIHADYLDSLINYILVELPVQRHTVRHYQNYIVDYPVEPLQYALKHKKNPETGEPFKQASELFYTSRKIVNNTDFRVAAVLEIMEDHPKLIIFYNFDYERDLLINMCESNSISFSEWNGHSHQELPTGDSWCYLVQYTAGAEGWNCIETDTIIFFSLNYSYKTTMQACGRIDRMNTPFVDLYYYFIKSNAWIDKAIFRALKHKEKFNENVFYRKMNSREKHGV